MRYFPVITMLTAGAVTCIISIANGKDELLSLELLLGVLIVFYIMGMIARAIIMKVMETGGIKKEEETDTETEGTGEDAVSQEETQGQKEAQEQEDVSND